MLGKKTNWNKNIYIYETFIYGTPRVIILTVVVTLEGNFFLPDIDGVVLRDIDDDPPGSLSLLSLLPSFNVGSNMVE